MSHPLTQRRVRPQQRQAPFRLPEKTASKGVPTVVKPMGGYPPPDSFQTKELGTEPITVQGFEGWALEGFDSCPRTTKSGMTMGEPIHGRGLSKRSLGMP